MDGYHFVRSNSNTSGNSPFEINAEYDAAESEAAGSHDYRYADLQDQLMTVVLENERLAAELEHVKYDEVKSLSNKLRAEQEKIREMEAQLRAKPVSQRRRKIAQSRKEILYKSRSMGNLSVDTSSEVDVDSISAYESDPEIAEDALLNQEEKLQSSLGFDTSWMSRRLKIWLSKKYDELVDDFAEVKTEVEIPNREGEQLNPFKLKRNMVRLGNFLDPFEEFIHSLGSITRWENPAISFMAFTIYMVIIYKDWLLSTIFLAIVSVFIFTYLRHKGLSFGNEVENAANNSSMEIEKDLSMRDQISILITVSRRSQNHAGMGSDLLERVRNIVLWREPELTKPVVMMFGMAFVGSLLFPLFFLVRMAGLFLGIHLFIIQFVFSRFPRLNRKYNKMQQFISQLKTDAEYETQMKKIKKDMKKTSKLSRSVSASTLCMSPAASSVSLNTVGTPEVTTPTSFNDTFRLPVSEIPLPVWKKGRRCVLVNTEKYFAVGFKIGRMYLTNNYLCFERTKTESNKNLAIPLETITSITKAKLYQWVPGGGKAIEIKTNDIRKALVFVFQVHVFGPIINRDEAFDSIMQIGFANDYTWAKTNEFSSTQTLSST